MKIKEVIPTAKIITGNNDACNDKNVAVDEHLTKINTVKREYDNLSLSHMASSQLAEQLLIYYKNNLAINMVTDEVYHYQNQVWTKLSDKMLMRDLADLFHKADETFNAKRLNAAVESLKLSLQEMGQPKKDLIFFKNGVYDIKNQIFREHDKNDWLTSNNEINYYSSKDDESFETHAPHFYKWLSNAAGNEKKAKNILAGLYMILANRSDWQLFIEITGEGGSGKSVFAKIATMLAGKASTITGTMEALEKPRDRALIVGHSLIVLPDQPRYMGSGAGLKAITGGDDVAIDPKYKTQFSCKITAIILIINNEPMKFTERNGGISRRRVIFDFNKVIPEDKRDLNLESKIERELPSIVRLLLKEFKNPLNARKCLRDQLNSDEAKAIKRESDPLVDFCSYLKALDEPNGMLIGNLGIISNPKKYLYHAYNEYIQNTGLKNPLSLTNFGSSLKYAMNENGKKYIKKRKTAGVTTNLEIDLEASKDWLPSL